MMCVTLEKRRPVNADFSLGNRKKSAGARSGEYGGRFSVVIFDQNRPVCWSIVVKEKPTDGSPFFGAFPSDRIAKVTKDVSVHFFTHCNNSYELYQQIPVNYISQFWKFFEATA